MVGASPSGSVVDSINNLDAALQARNKYGFVDGSCLKESYATSDVLSAQWDRCNVMVLTWIMNVASQDVYMGLVYSENVAVVWKELRETYDKVDGSVVYNVLQKINTVKQGGSSVADYYHRLNSLWREFDALTKLPKCTCDPVRSSLLTRDPLPEVKDAYNVISREESHRGVPESSGVTESKQNATSFVAKTFNNNKKQSNNNGNNFARGALRFDKPSSSSLSSGFTSEQIQKLLNLINDKSTSGMINVVDISDLKITVGHPNGTLAVISHVGNLKLANNVMLYDVLGVLRYCVSLLSVNKLIRDSKIFVGFDENKCYIQDLKRGKILETGSELCGLYLFDVNKSSCIDLNISDNTFVPMCEICQRAKQTREPFPLSDHKSKTLGELVHLDLWGPYRVHSREGYRYFLTIVDDYSRALPHSPYDDGRDSSNMDGSLPHTDSHDSTQVNDDVHTPVLRRSDRQSKLPVRLNDYILSSNVKYGIEKYVNYIKLSRVNMCFATYLNKSVEPTCLSEALSDPNWVEAMNNEIEALNRNNTWTICDLPIGRKPIGSKWLWKIKYKASGDIERYKARLVAKGYSQREGFDYDETFSLVVKMVTVRCLRALAVVNNWPLFQLDVNNAFLYGHLLEDVYMTLPEGYNNDNNTKSKLDYSLYTKHNGEKFIALLVYLDDIVITGNDNIGINDFKVFLSTKFMIKDLGILKYFLGIEVVENDLGLCMSQWKYCLELLHEYGLLAARLVDIPLPENYILGYEETSNDKYLADFTSYQKLVAALRVLRYLKGSPGCEVQFYKNFDLKLKAYADADWAKCPKTRRSMSTTSSEVVWLGNLLHSLGLRNLYPVELFCDNSSAIQIAVNPVFKEKTKHFELDVHFVKEKVLAGEMVGKDSRRKGHAGLFLSSFKDVLLLILVSAERAKFGNDQMDSVINCETVKSTWDDLILYHEGPSDVKEINDGIKLSKLKINTGFINGLPKKWPSFCQSLGNTNHVKESELASLFGKLIYEESLIDSIYDTEKKKSLTTATPLSTAFFSTFVVQDFQDSPDDEEDTRDSQEYLNDLKEEFQEKALDQMWEESSSQQQHELRPTKDFEAKYNKVKAKLALLNSSALASKSSMVKNKGLVLMALANDENVVVGKESARNGEWVKISIRKVHTLLEMEDNDERNFFINYLCIDLNYVEEQRNNLMLKHRDLVQELNTCKEQFSGQKDLVFVKSSADDTKVSIPCVERPWLSKAEGFILPNHDTSRILSAESQMKVTDPSVAVTDSLVTDYDSTDEFLVCSTPLPRQEKLAGAEPVSGPKTMKSILKSNSTFKAETLKGITINEPTSAPAKANKNVSASKRNSTPAGKLKNVKTEDDIPLSVVTKELNDLKLQINKKSVILLQKQQTSTVFCKKCERTDHRTCDHAEYMSTMNMSQHLKSQVWHHEAHLFDEKKGIIFNSNKEVVMISPRVRDVYILDMTSLAQKSCFFAKASESLNLLWHKRLAHLNFKTINQLAKQNLVIGLPLLVYSKDKPCSSCEKRKHHRASFKTKQTSSIKKCLHLLHMDLFGHVTPRSINHEKHTLVIVDEYSRYT
ncbi:ribonuclease H-like domain-containing protein [Tanacetum coccineum]